ncbi:phage head-tail joining protein [Chitinophaga sp. sic0106]|uniref:phage head-tail joining protein n=1 Tax=Chitinophaga sp. sic0106 TaxID=2854785 RepID=UPI001C46284B|nr:hypothetical protein [Chitinophaga sp. sic0106]MBV7529027.1 hypothetical protein [Chitinophaga sp. sic0106]
MGFTIDQYNLLVNAIAQGAKRVKYADKEVEYASLDDMLRLKSAMEVELGIKKGGIKTSLAAFSKGLNR